MPSTSVLGWFSRTVCLRRVGYLLPSLLLAGCALGPHPAQPASAASAPDYQVRLARPSSAGDKYTFTAKMTETKSINTVVDGSPARQENVDKQLEFSAETTVIAVSPTGREQKLLFVVRRARHVANGVASEFLPAGTVVIAEQKGGETVFSGVDRAITAAAVADLRLILELDKNGLPTDDDVFGTTRRRKVGDVWPMNTAIAAAGLSSVSPVVVNSGDISGQTRLIDVTDFDGHPVMTTESEMEVRNSPISGPPGLSFQSGTYRTVTRCTLPLAVEKGDASQDLRMVSVVTFAGKDNGRQADMTVATSTRLELNYEVR